MKTNNIIMGVLVAVIAVMGVAFAAFSTTLTISGTANISSNWLITFTAGDCTAVNKDATAKTNGTVSMESDGVTAKINANMMSPGDTLSCTISAKNAGSLSATRKSWALTTDPDGSVTNPDAYEVTLTASDADGVLNANDSEILTVTITYKDVTTKPTGKATFKAQAVYAQTGVQ